MAKQVKQFRYYGDNNPNNTSRTTFKGLINGEVFKDYVPILQLGIQALPGTRFFLNGNTTSPIIVGGTGIYDLDLNGLTEITALQFAATSLNAIKNNNNAYLIVDIIYDNGVGGN